MKAFAYLRKSTNSEDRQILSLESQMNEILKLADSRGMEIVKVYQEAQSAKKAHKRPEFTDMMERVWKGEVRHILTWKLDRLARNPLDGAAVITALQEGLLESIITPHKTFHKDDNVLYMQIEFGMANQYIRDLSVNVKRGMKTKAENGGWNHHAPLGYKNKSVMQGEKIVEKTIDIDESRVAYIREIFELRLSGMTFEQIGKEISSKGLRSRKGKRIGKRATEKILKNPFYIGFIKYGEELLTGAHTPIISAWIFDKVQKVRPHLTTKVNPMTFPFKRFLLCFKCKTVLSGYLAKKIPYYRCSTKGCRGNYSQKMVEEMIGRAISAYDCSKKEREMIERGLEDAAILVKTKGQDELRRYERRIREAEEAKDVLIEMRQSGELEEADYKKRYKASTVDLKVMREELDKIKTNIAKANNSKGNLKLLENLSGTYFVLKSADKARFARRFSSNFLISPEKALPSQEEPVFKAIREAKGVLWSG